MQMDRKFEIEIIVRDYQSLWTIYCADFEPLHAGLGGYREFDGLDELKFDDYFKEYDYIKIIIV